MGILRSGFHENKRSNLMVPRLKEEYKQRVVGAMTEEFSYRNRMEVPKLQKIVISRVLELLLQIKNW